MKIRTKLALFIVNLAAVMIVGLFLLSRSQQKPIHVIYDEKKGEVSRLLTKVVEKEGLAFESFVDYEYSLWNEMDDFVKAPRGSEEGKAWVEGNVDESSLETYRLAAIWIYRKDLSLAYVLQADPRGPFGQVPLSAETFERLVKSKLTFHFFQPTDHGLMEIRGASIHPADDTKRNKTSPDGYFLAGRLWDEAFMGYLAEMIGGKLTLAGKAGPPASPSIESGRIQASLGLEGLGGEQVATLLMKRQAPLITSVLRSLDESFRLLAALALTVLILTFITVVVWVGSPLGRISKSLKEEKPDALEGLLGSKDEFGRVAGLIKRSFDQKKELLRTKEAAEAATLAKTRFISTMSFGIRTQIHAIRGAAGLMMESRLEAEKLEYVRAIASGSDALVGVVSEMFDFARLESGRKLEPEALNLRDLVESVTEMFASRAEEKMLDIEVLIDSATPARIVTDPVILRQALANLIGNAIKFTEEGDVLILVRPKRSSAGEAEIQFTVRDTGIGLPHDRLERLFQAYGQLETSTVRQVGGTGLGLALCKRLVELMGGRIWAESREGEGSSFHFTIVAATEPPDPRPWETADQQGLKGRKLLIVNDNPAYHDILGGLAGFWGMDVQAVRGGMRALSLIEKRGPFDAVVLDWRTSEMDAAATASRIRQPAGSKAPALILLAPRGLETGLKVDFDAVVHKPVRMASLHRELLRLLAPSTGPGTPEGMRGSLDPDMGRRHPLRILVTEDNDLSRRIDIQILGRLGYHADAVRTGKDAIDAMRRAAYDVILMDLHMPVMDGIEASRRIRSEWPAGRQPGILLMTASVLPEDRESALAAGAKEFFVKPVSIDDLKTALLRITPLPGAAGETGAAPVAEQELLSPEARTELEAGTDRDYYEEIFRLYLAEAEKTIAEMAVALKAGDAAGLADLAHTFKGSSAHLLARRLVTLCGRMEEEGRAGRLEACGTLRDEIEKEVRRVEALIRSMAQKHGLELDRA
jgi:signal transduction histidine kinase/DNA-binding response OmpR family regulator/HPt (histidine-containing phosphotransfer) domain-containing protein